MTDPAIAVRMNVGSLRMALLVAIRWTAFAATGTATATSVAALCLN
jgi:hypothetical protein